MYPPTTLHVQLFGGLTLAWDDQPRPPISSAVARSLLAYLVTFRDRPHARDLLAGTLWPDLPDRTARRRLRQALWQVRRALAPHPVLLTKGDTVQFNPATSYWLDVQEFERLCASEQTRDLADGVALYRGDFLAGTYDDWVLVQRERLRTQYLDVLRRLVAGLKAQEDYKTALGYARRLATENPLREEAHREVMRLCHLLGRPAEALEQYELCRTALADELGVEPAAATIALAQEIAAVEQAFPSGRRTGQPARPTLKEAAVLPLVGRQAERAALLAHVEEALAGHGGLVLVEGEAGVGKTRLLQEMAQGAAWRGAQVAWGRGLELAPMPPYSVLAGALGAALSPLRAGQLAELVPGVELRAASRLLPALTDWLPRDSLPPHVPLGPAQDRERLLEALARTVLALGQIAPHLFVLEDLHWADESTLAALAHLVHCLSQSRVLVIATYRGEEARERPAVWKALQVLDRAGLKERLILERLDAAATGELVRRGLGLTAAVPRFEARLYAETKGNPLFVLETLQALRDEELLTRDAAGAWSTPWDETTIDYAELPLPDSVAQVIARRLVRLTPLARAVLNVAAVLGGDFDFSTLAQASHLERPAALTTVSELVRRHFLVEGPETYAFSHDQVRRVACTEIEEAERQKLHRQAGWALEALHPDQVERLARHFSLGRVWDKAVDYNRQAGDRARAVYAGAQAISYYDRALEAWGHLQPPDERLGSSLYLERGRICQETGRFDQAEADFRTACDLAERVGKAGQARALNHLSYLQLQRGDFSDAAAIAQQALDLATAAELPSEIAAGLFNKANAIRNLGHYRQAIGLYEQAADIFEGLDDQIRLADCLNRMGAASYHMGDYVRARSLIERSLTIRRRLDDRIGISYSLINLAALCYYQGQFVHVEKAAQEALELASAIGDPYGEDAALHDLGLAALEQGAPTQAISFFQRTLRIAGEIGDRALELETLAELGRAYHHLGDLDKARETLEQALGMMSISVERRQAPVIHAYLAHLFLAADRDEEALAHARTGLQAAQELEEPWSLGLAHRAMGQVAAQLGSEEGAGEPGLYFEEGIRILRELGAEAELARSLAAYGFYLRRSADAGKAQRGAALVDKAGVLFQQSGMAGDLARLEAEAATYLLPGQMRVRLPRAEAPTGRPLRDDEYVEVAWTVAAPEDEAITGKVARRQRQLSRLLAQAADQGAAPTVDDLATALGVSRATLKRDLAALRRAGHEVKTRGRRSR